MTHRSSRHTMKRTAVRAAISAVALLGGLSTAGIAAAQQASPTGFVPQGYILPNGYAAPAPRAQGYPMPQPDAGSFYPYPSPGFAPGAPAGVPITTPYLQQLSRVQVDPNDPRTDSINYSNYLGRQHGNLYYRAPITRQLVDDRPYIATTDQRFQAQYAIRRAGMRQLDAQNRRSGYRMVGANAVPPRQIVQPVNVVPVPQRVQVRVQQPVIQQRTVVSIPTAPVARAPIPAPAAAKVGDVVYLDRIFFDHDRDNVTQYSVTILQQLAAFMLQNPDSIVVLEGHADQSGDVAYNIGLSNRRSANARIALQRLGVPASRIRIQGFGEARPDKPAVTADGRRLDNRRVEFRVIATKPVKFVRPQVVRAR